MKLYIYANAYTEKQKQESARVSERLTQGGHVLCADAKDAELIVSIGGDGALLRAAQRSIDTGIPVAGINSGRLGYLCCMKMDEIDEFDRIISEGRRVQRSLLECRFGGVAETALNDIVVSKPNFGETVDLHLQVGPKEQDIRGDGLIIATPTGSTAYNLSAGGPVLDYDAPVFAITPICPHFGSGNPMVVRDDKEIVISINHGLAHVYSDGRRVGAIDDQVRIGRSRRTITLIL